MPQFNDTELTAAVIRSFEETPDPRVKFLMEELVKSLHDFVRKTDLTFDEWGYAIDFLTRTGQKCSSTRQEFILLSDVLGVSMLVDAVNHRQRDGATETTVLGPFYVGEHKPMPHGSDISANLTGERMFVQSRVTDLGGKPLAGIPVDVWHLFWPVILILWGVGMLFRGLQPRDSRAAEVDAAPRRAEACEDCAHGARLITAA